MSGTLSYITTSANKITFLPNEHTTIDGHAEKSFQKDIREKKKKKK